MANIAIEVNYTPNPKQTLFHQSMADMLVYGGAKAGGKSCALVMDAFLYALQNPGALIYLYRESYDDLNSNLIREWKDKVPRDLYEYSETKHIAILTNGSEVIFRYIANDADAEGYQGRSMDYVGVDELTKHNKRAIQVLLSCLRSPKGFHPRFRGTCNPGSRGHCVPFGEVLTPTGWRDIQDFQIGDSVYTVDENRNLKLSEVGQVHREYYSGDLININGKGLKIYCTPEHKIANLPGTKKKDTKYKLVKFEDLPGQAFIVRTVKWKGNDLDFFEPEKTNSRVPKLDQPKKITGIQFCKFMGWFLSEGYYLSKDKRFGICQSKVENRIKIKELLDECGFKYKESKDSFTMYANDWAGYLKQFGKCRDKFIPQVIKDLDIKYLEAFFECLMDGDGHWENRGKSGQYYTISKRLCEDVSEVAVKLGYIVKVYERNRENRIGLHYSINLFKNRNGTTEILTGNHLYNVSTKTKRSSQINKTQFEGYVYCLGIPETHTFLIRQNGSVWVSGNSWVKEDFVLATNYGKEIASDPVTGQSIEFIPANVYDNYVIMQNDPNYVKRLENLPESERKAFLLGSWDLIEGQFFDQWDPTLHVVEPFTIPAHWNRYISLDYGMDCTAAFWWCVDKQGFCYAYRELHEPKLILSAAAKRILEMTPESEKIDYIVASPDIWNKRQESGSSGAEIMFKAGLKNLVKANNKRIPGWRAMREMLAPTTDEFGEPAAQIRFFPTCKNAIRNIPMVQYDDSNSEDASDEPHSITHAPESIRYFCMSRPRMSKDVSEPEHFNFAHESVQGEDMSFDASYIDY